MPLGKLIKLEQQKRKDIMLVDYKAHKLNLGDFEGSNSKRDQGTEDASNFQ